VAPESEGENLQETCKGEGKSLHSAKIQQVLDILKRILLSKTAAFLRSKLDKRGGFLVEFLPHAHAGQE
jgi:hypothetical protein